MSQRQLIVVPNHAKTFKINIPEDARVVFEHIIPVTDIKQTQRYDQHFPLTLKILDKDGVGLLACFTDVGSFRELSLNYMEEVVKEETASIWKSDQNGYEREEHSKKNHQWNGEVKAIKSTRR